MFAAGERNKKMRKEVELSAMFMWTSMNKCVHDIHNFSNKFYSMASFFYASGWKYTPTDYNHFMIDQLAKLEVILI